MTNDIFAENAWYFRNALVRANYNDVKKGIRETTEFLEIFLRSLLLGEDHLLRNRALHICGKLAVPDSTDLGRGTADTSFEPTNIEATFTATTASHIQKLREALGTQPAFDRSDVQRVLGLQRSRSSVLLHEMVKGGIIEPVPGHRRGKYRFVTALDIASIESKDPSTDLPESSIESETSDVLSGEQNIETDRRTLALHK